MMYLLKYKMKIYLKKRHQLYIIYMYINNKTTLTTVFSSLLDNKLTKLYNYNTIFP